MECMQQRQGCKRQARVEFVEALKFATKAKKLCADVVNITHVITICEVHNAAKKKLSATDLDWYAILQIEGLATKKCSTIS